MLAGVVPFVHIKSKPFVSVISRSVSVMEKRGKKEQIFSERGLGFVSFSCT